MVANLSIVKDHATLLKAWRLVLDRLTSMRIEAVLVLARRFDGATDSAKALAYDLELGRSVRFLGKVSDISGLLSAVDLGVFSSRSEGSPNGLQECMAAGLAVAATDIAGIRDVVGVEGVPFLAPPGNADALAEKILELIQNPKLRRRMGEANRRRIALEFSTQRMGRETIEILYSHLRR